MSTMRSTTSQEDSASTASSPQLRPRPRRVISSKTRPHRAPLRSSQSSSHISLASPLPMESGPTIPPQEPSTDTLAEEEDQSPQNTPSHHTRLITQVVDWLHGERTRRALRRNRASQLKTSLGMRSQHLRRNAGGESEIQREDTSDASETSAALDKLEEILGRPVEPAQHRHRLSLRPFGHRRPSHRRARNGRLRRASSSDTDYLDLEALVPACEAVLDNTKTLGHNTAQARSNLNLAGMRAELGSDTQEWVAFKEEIVRLAQVLGLKGWRRVPADHGREVGLERLSGALTNAVYVVSPPKVLDLDRTRSGDSESPIIPRKPPPKLLLRIYGPQVDYLVDREVELRILKRLARKSIGPRVLGIFSNGRFEEYFHARTLAPEDIRHPDISKQIAKRMRELHDGIELLKEEREGGPAVWKNWDRWAQRAGEVISWTDQQIALGPRSHNVKFLRSWRNRGLICGVQWSLFCQTVQRCRQWIIERYKSMARIKSQLVFSHNDTQYGNILRLEPSGESPLLLPANEHKRLVVIDFEYAAPNLPALEFANHFTEWCYDYRDTERPYALREAHYPNLDEQRRFLRSYVEHTPGDTPRPTNPTTTPHNLTRSNSSISAFMLDSRTPPAQLVEEEARRNSAVEGEVERLMLETRLWRVANSAQWVAWGVVQATIPEMAPRKKKSSSSKATNSEGVSSRNEIPLEDETSLDGQSKPEEPRIVKDGSNEEGKGEGGEAGSGDGDGEFDYLGYAQERAMLFWGDVIKFGIVSKSDLPAELLAKVKNIKY
ncbi:MAG: hypothetical protein M1823_002195 [Watsoniomyces obsoletus]|nr:MAG: hypothetical protein M1823_002195 [Watsoniomyces obsoletus]